MKFGSIYQISLVISIIGFFVLFLLFLTRFQFFRLDTDYDSNLSQYYFVVEYIQTHHTFPDINPYAGNGMPVIGDPLSPLFHPLFLATLVLFGVDVGMRVVIVWVSIGAGLMMWMLLRLGTFRPWISLWGAALYGISGALAARIAAGHVEKVLSYPLLPLGFYLLFYRDDWKRQSIRISLLVSLFIYGGDWYTAYMFGILCVVCWIYEWWENRNTLSFLVRRILFCGSVCLLASSAKIIPFVQTVQPIMERYFTVDPFHGSIHSIIEPLVYILPFRSWFYDRPSIQQALGFGYNWYEYYAFISPIPILFIVFYFHELRKRVLTRKVLILVYTGLLYVASGFFYSPFYWINQLIPVVQSVRVPSRIIFVMMPLVVFLAAHAIGWSDTGSKKRKVWIYILSTVALVWTGVSFVQVSKDGFEKRRVVEKDVIQFLREFDPGDYTVVTAVCCVQTELVQAKIPVQNFYYGWIPKGTPRFIDTTQTKPDYTSLPTYAPKYVVTNTAGVFYDYGYFPFITEEHIVIWKKK